MQLQSALENVKAALTLCWTTLCFSAGASCVGGLIDKSLCFVQLCSLVSENGLWLLEQHESIWASVLQDNKHPALMFLNGY